MINLSDASSRLARWRLRLLGYDFTVHYHTGAKNAVADAISRLPTYGQIHINPDEEIPTLRILSIDHSHENVCASLSDRLKTDGRETVDYQDFADMLAKDDAVLEEGVPVLVLEARVKNTSGILLETFVEEQSTDKFCQNIRRIADEGNTNRYRYDDRGLLARFSSVDLPVQIVVPKSLEHGYSTSPITRKLPATPAAPACLQA